MGKYFDEQSAKQIGSGIKEYRKNKGYSLQDVAAMTGFTVNTISQIENGGESTLSYLIAICQALEVHPSDLLRINIDLRPRFALPPKRVERNKTTYRIKELVEATDFFDQPRLVGAVVEEFKAKYNNSPLSSEISTALKKLVVDGKLDYSKKGRKNFYVKIK